MGTGVAGTNANLASITAVILGGAALTGGVGGIGGTLIGVLIVGVLVNGMALLQIPPYLQTMTTGGVLLLAVAFSQLRGFLEEGVAYRSIEVRPRVAYEPEEGQHGRRES